MAARYDLNGVWRFSYEKPTREDERMLSGITAQAEKENIRAKAGYLVKIPCFQ